MRSTGTTRVTSSLDSDSIRPSSITRAIRTLIPRSTYRNTNCMLLIYPPSRHPASTTPTTERPSETRRTNLRNANPSHYLEPSQGTRLLHAPNPPYRNHNRPARYSHREQRKPTPPHLAVPHSRRCLARLEGYQPCGTPSESPSHAPRRLLCAPDARATRGNKLRDRAHTSLTMTEMGKGAWLGAGGRAGHGGGSWVMGGAVPTAASRRRLGDG
jgi:hypothetical protein